MILSLNFPAWVTSECVCTQLPGRVWLWDPTECSLPDSSVPGISQARILEWVATSFFRGSSLPRDLTHLSWVSCTGRWVLYQCAIWEAQSYSWLFLILQISWVDSPSKLCASFLLKILGFLHSEYKLQENLWTCSLGSQREETCTPAYSQIVNPTFNSAPNLVPHHFLMPDWSE